MSCGHTTSVRTHDGESPKLGELLNGITDILTIPRTSSKATHMTNTLAGAELLLAAPV